MANSTTILRLERGDKLVEEIKKHCQKINITSAWITGIGALSKSDLAFYHLETKTFARKTYEQPLELVSLSGNLGELDGNPVTHFHVVLSDENMQTFGGHLDEAIVAATCEISITELDSQITRQYNDEIGLNLIV